MKRFKRLGVYPIILSAVAIISVVLRCTALFTQYNPDNFYFNGKILINFANGILFAGILMLLSFSFLSRKINVSASFKGPETFIPSGMVSCALIFLAAEIFVEIIDLPGEFLTAETILANLLPLLVALFAVFSGINFFVTVLFSNRECDQRALFGILTVLFLAFYSAYLYFDKQLPLNAPNKIIDQTAFLFVALFFLYETRISLGREMWRCYCAFGLSASLITAYSSVPTLIYYFASGRMISDSLAGAVLSFTLCIYITSRVISVVFLLDNEKSREVIAIERLAEYRKEELSLPEQLRTDNNEENFTTFGKNYEFNLPISEKRTQEDISDIPYESEKQTNGENQ